MKTMVKLGMMLALATSLAVYTTEAQPGHGKGERGYGPGNGMGFRPDSCHLQLMVDDMAKALSLTDKQKADILELHYAHMAEMKSIPGKYKNDCVGEREARIAARKELDESVKKLLTAEQLAKYDEFMEQRRGPHAQDHPQWK